MKYLIVLSIFIGSLFAQDVAPVNNELYVKECGYCHFAYQAGLLPSSSWNKIMSNL